MDFLAPRGVNRFSRASGAAFKDTWQPNFCLASQAQLGELVFTLNRQAGLTLKMNIQSLRREWRAEGERQSHQQWQTRAGSQAAPGWGQVYTAPAGCLPRRTSLHVQGLGCLSGRLHGIWALPDEYKAATLHSRPRAMQTVTPIDKDTGLPVPCLPFGPFLPLLRSLRP